MRLLPDYSQEGAQRQGRRMGLQRKLRLCLLLLAVLALAQAFLAPVAAAAGNPPMPESADGRPRDMENDPDLYLQLIAEMQGKNLYFASLAHLDAFDRRWPGNPRAALLRADGLREAGYAEPAAALYRSLVAGPQAAGAYHGLGVIAGRRDEIAAALAALEQASRLAPTSALVLNDLGYMQLRAGRLGDARFNLHKATELDPKNTRAGANLALLYLLENKPERAAGIMQWYQLPDSHRQEIQRQAERLADPAKAPETSAPARPEAAARGDVAKQ